MWSASAASQGRLRQRSWAGFKFFRHNWLRRTSAAKLDGPHSNEWETLHFHCIIWLKPKSASQCIQNRRHISFTSQWINSQHSPPNKFIEEPVLEKEPLWDYTVDPCDHRCHWLKMIRLENMEKSVLLSGRGYSHSCVAECKEVDFLKERVQCQLSS